MLLQLNQKKNNNYYLISDIDFTIDKKLEQDLWNLVFKSQINYFQAQIKENSSLATNNSSSSINSNLTSSANNLNINKNNKNISSQNKYEAQASLFFFLEAARGFYTKVCMILLFILFLIIITKKNFKNKVA